MGMIRVLIADDQQILIEGITTLLNLEDDIQVVGQAKNGIEVLNFLQENSAPDVILMDIRMPEMNGVECTKQVGRLYPGIRVLILTTFDDDQYISEALSNGADGYLLKDLSAEKLTSAIRSVFVGNSVMDQIVSGRIAKHFQESPSHAVGQRLGRIKDMQGSLLHEREEQVLRLLAKGYSNSEIAEELFLSEGTVKNYISTLYEKIGIKGRTKLMRFAIEQGILESENASERKE
ncbi:response regulator transcription factor [Gottschalkiaceae bacterium SANA]|nr:response regulator transcription factor [Gottschalkiaceae bacterium SANA]